MPLTVRVGFKARLEARNMISIPRLVRWQYKLESEQVLKVRVKLADTVGSGEEFYGQMRRDGRLTIPKLTVDALCQNYEVENLVGQLLEVSLEPAEA